MILDFIPRKIRHLRDWADFVLKSTFDQFVSDTEIALGDKLDKTTPLTTNTGTLRDASQISTVWTNSADATRTSAVSVSTVTNAGALTESLKISSGGIDLTSGSGFAAGTGNITLNQYLTFLNGNIMFYNNTMRWLRFRAGRGYGLAFNPSTPVGFSSDSAMSTNVMDVALNREGAGILAQKAGAQAQAYRLYGTTDGQAELNGNNYERLSVSHTTTEVLFASEAGGTGVARPFRFAGRPVIVDESVILRSPNGHYWAISVDDSGVLSTADLGATQPA